MFISLLQSITFFLLAGVLFYLLLSPPGAIRPSLINRIFIGLIFGLLGVLLHVESFALPDSGISISAKAGPMVFAGYLGGLPGALIAAAMGAGYRLAAGTDAVLAVLFIHFALAAVGLLTARIVVSRPWPAIPIRAVGGMLAGFTIVQCIPPLWFGLFDVSRNSPAQVWQNAFVILAAGWLSILVMWQVLHHATRVATQSKRERELSRRLEEVLRSAGMGISDWVVGSDSAHCDSGTLALYGIDREPGQIRIVNILSMIHEDDVDAVRRTMQEASRPNATATSINYRLFRQTDGALRYISAIWRSQQEPGTGEIHVLSIATDVTDSLQAQHKLSESQNRLDVLAEHLPGVVIQVDVTDGSPHFLYISKRSRQYTGYTPEEIYADPELLIRQHVDDDHARFLLEMRQGIDSGEPFTIRFRIKRPDGELRWMEFRGNSRSIEERVRVDAIVLDVTREVEDAAEIEKEREVARAAQKNESIGHLTGGIAHDFNNLLAVILGNLELLRDDNESDKRSVWIDSAISASLRGADLTKNLLAFARKATLEPEVLDLNTVVLESKNWMTLALADSITVETSLLAGLWRVSVDRSSLESALLNLILNACDAMDNRGKLTIETANVRIDDAYVDTRDQELTPGRYVMLAVSDTGQGIPAAVSESLFEPFVTTKPPGEGSGLGLSMVFGFMRQSGGTIQVYSEPEHGTTFKLYFPAIETESVVGSRQSLKRRSRHHSALRILLAEDDAAVRQTLMATLQLAGHDVIAVGSGDAALDAFTQDHDVDLLLTDIVMPGRLLGNELAREIRKLRADLPVIYMSGYANEATVHGNGLSPGDIRLMKPVQKSDLLNAIRKIVDH